MGLGQRLTHSIASFFDFTCQSQKPAISSFVSAKGPSITVRLLPENLTRAPFELGWSPSPASSTPAFTSSSLNFPISVRSCSLGITPASESLLAFTITKTLIVISPCDFVFKTGFPVASTGGTRALLQRRIRNSHIDTQAHYFSDVLLMRLVGRIARRSTGGSERPAIPTEARLRRLQLHRCGPKEGDTAECSR